MPLIWCAISGHGFGHAAQLIPVLNELGRRVPGLTAHLRTTVPGWFFQARLAIPWTRSEAEQDIGCAQDGPLRIDVPATWAEHRRLHAMWEKRVSEEARAIQSHKPSLLLADIPYLAIQAGARARVRVVGLSSLSWDCILEPFLTTREPERSDQQKIIRQIEQAYGFAGLMIRPAPGIPLKAFSRIVDVGPIAQVTPPERERLRRVLKAAPADRIVLVAFGGVPLNALPFQQMEDLAPYRFLVSQPAPPAAKRATAFASLPFSFRALLASADLIMTKPGYSTIVEAVAHGIPVVYVRRYNFADEACLVEYLHRYGRGVELAVADFLAGRWRDALDAGGRLAPPTQEAPPPTGAPEAADLLAAFFNLSLPITVPP